MDLNYIDPESRALNKYFLFAIIQHNKYTLEKATYMDIQIAHDDLQRLDLFKLAQFLRIPHNQLPLLRLRTQATSYIPTHLHLSNINDDDCFYYHYWRNNVVIAFGTLSSFLT